MSFYATIGSAVTLALLLAACFYDCKTKIIPNALTIPAMAIGLLYCILLSLVVHSFSVCLMRVILFVGIFFFGMTGLLGMGDIKLLMAVSLFNGPYTTLYTIIIACVMIVFFQCITNWEGTKYKVFSGINMVMTKNVVRIKKDTENTKPFVPYLLAAYICVILGAMI